MGEPRNGIPPGDNKLLANSGYEKGTYSAPPADMYYVTKPALGHVHNTDHTLEEDFTFEVSMFDIDCFIESPFLPSHDLNPMLHLSKTCLNQPPYSCKPFTTINCLNMCVDPVVAPEGLHIQSDKLHRLNPLNLKLERAHDWPRIVQDQIPPHMKAVYEAIRSTGLPNALENRQYISSGLKIQNWRALATGHHDDSWLIELLQFGSLLQYTGPPPTPLCIDNHSSARAYPEHVRKYIEKELSEGALIGPLSSHPFPSAPHVNPIMSRPKSDPSEWRIIVDLSYPLGEGVNAKVYKGCVFGTHVNHSLPTIQQATHRARAMNLDIYI